MRGRVRNGLVSLGVLLGLVLGMAGSASATGDPAWAQRCCAPPPACLGPEALSVILAKFHTLEWTIKDFQTVCPNPCPAPELCPTPVPPPFRKIIRKRCSRRAISAWTDSGADIRVRRCREVVLEPANP